MAFQLLIDGNDRTRKVAEGSLKISNVLTNRRDTCDFIIVAHAGDTYVPTLGEEVIVYDGATKIFGGVIVTLESSPVSYKIIHHKISCQDYTRLLDHRLVPDSFTNQTVDEIIVTLKASYFPEDFTINNVNAPVTIKYIAFKYRPLAVCLEDLAKLINYDWYVDYDKDVHFFAKESMAAPFDLADDTGTYHYDSLVIRKDNSQIRNSIIVRGGEYIGSQLTTLIETTGIDAIYPLPYRFADFATHLTGHVLDLGIDNIDNADAHDALYNFQEKIIRFKEGDKPSSGKSMRISGKPYLPVIVKYKSPADILAMVSAESNATFTSDGIYEYLIEDKSINSKEGARQRAQAEITAYAQTLSEGEFTTESSGLRAGQAININSASRDLNEMFIINQVVINQFTATQLIYNISLITTRTFDLIDVLQRLLLQSTKNIEIDPNEVTDTIYELSDEAEFSDSLTTPSTYVGASYPYVWETVANNALTLSRPSDQRVTVADPSGVTNFAVGDSYTLMFWIKYTDLVTDMSVSEHWEGTGYQWAIRSAVGLRFNIYDNTNNPGVSAGDVTDGNWHFIVFERDRPNLKLRAYADNVLIQETTDTTTGSLGTTNGFAIGARSIGGGFHFTGSLDEFAIVGRLLTSVERSAFYNSGTGVKIDANLSNLKALYRFDESSGLTAVDLSSNKIHGVLVNDPTRGAGKVTTPAYNNRWGYSVWS